MHGHVARSFAVLMLVAVGAAGQAEPPPPTAAKDSKAKKAQAGKAVTAEATPSEDTGSSTTKDPKEPAQNDEPKDPPVPAPVVQQVPAGQPISEAKADSNPDRWIPLALAALGVLLVTAIGTQILTLFKLRSLSDAPGAPTDLRGLQESFARIESQVASLNSQLRNLDRAAPAAAASRTVQPAVRQTQPAAAAPIRTAAAQPQQPLGLLGLYLAASVGTPDDQYRFVERFRAEPLSAVNPDDRRRNPLAELRFEADGRGRYLAIADGGQVLLFPQFNAGFSESDQNIFPFYGSGPQRLARPAVVAQRGSEWILVEPGAFQE